MILGKKKTVPDIKPEDATMWGNKGNSLVQSSMYDDAIKCYDKAIEINPGLIEAWNNKGLALARTGRMAEAIKCYDKALEIDPGDSEVIYNKGISMALLGKSKDAIECYDKLLAVNPQDADASCSKGDVLFESGRYEEALASYNKSIEIDPKDEVTWNNRGMTLVKLNRFAEAIESYDKALEINPKVEKIWSNKGLAIAKMEESKDKVDLQKIAATLPREDKIPAVNIQTTGQPDMQPAKQENTPLNNQVISEKVNTAPVIEAPLSGQVDIIPDMQDNDAIYKAADVQADTSMQPVDASASATVASPSGQAGIKPDEQRSIPELSIEKAESIANEKIADIEKYLLSLPVDKAASAAVTLPKDQIQPVNQETESPVIQTEAIKDEVKTAPIAENTVPGQMEITPPKGELEQKSPEIADINEKYLVSVPVDTYIVNPFISKPPSDQTITKTDEEGANSQQENKTSPAIDSDILRLVEIEDKYRSNPVPDKALQPEKVKKSQEQLVMGNTFYSQGKYEDAIECFNKSLQMHLGNNTAWNNKGLALSKTGKFDEAIICYDRALVINPKDYVVLNNKGSALYKKGDIGKALQCYRDALELNPGNKTAKRGVKICTGTINKAHNDDE